MIKLSNKKEFAVARAVLTDAVAFEGGEWVVDDENCAAVKINGMHKCVFGDIGLYRGYAAEYGLYGKTCLLDAPENAAELLRFKADPCKTFAYLEPMPPELDLPAGVEIKRLATTLAEVVLSAYHNPGSYTAERIATLMRDKGVFGAISDGKLAGFIGRHSDGSMGMLEVFDGFKRRGIGGALERFLITYVMTFGRTPYCDVFANNEASMYLQRRLGLTESAGYTFWGEIEE